MKSSPRGDERCISVCYVRPVAVDRITIRLTFDDRVIIECMDDKPVSSQRTINMQAERHPVAPDLPAPQRREAVPHRVKITLRTTNAERLPHVPKDKDGRPDPSVYLPEIDEAIVEDQEKKFSVLVPATSPLRAKFRPNERFVCFRAEVTEGGLEIGERLDLPRWW